MRSQRTLKGLQSQLKTLQADTLVLKNSLNNIQKDYKTKLDQIKRIEDQINELKFDGNITVSEHAIIRYLQRVEGLDISKVKQSILTDKVKEMIETLGGSGKYPNQDFQVVVKNHTVTTIIKK